MSPDTHSALSMTCAMCWSLAMKALGTERWIRGDEACNALSTSYLLICPDATRSEIAKHRRWAQCKLGGLNEHGVTVEASWEVDSHRHRPQWRNSVWEEIKADRLAYTVYNKFSQKYPSITL